MADHDELDDEAYLEMRKQDPDFQRLVEEEMAKIKAEMTKYAVDAGSEDVYVPPTDEERQRDKSELLYSAQKSYAPPPPQYVPPENRQAVKKQQMDSYLFGLQGSGNGGPGAQGGGGSSGGHGPASAGNRAGNCVTDVPVDIVAARRPYNARQDANDYYSSKRDKQEAYARQLKAQTEEVKPDSADNRRATRVRRPSSPILTQNAMSNIGNYELNKASPDAKKKGQLQYAAQLAEGRAAPPIPTERAMPLHIQRQQRQQAVLDAQFTDSVDASMGGQGQGLQSSKGYSVGGGRGNVGGSEDDQVRANERRAKQLEYARQLRNDKQSASVDEQYRREDSVGSKAARYREAQEQYRSSKNNMTGLNIGGGGCGEGGPSAQSSARGAAVRRQSSAEDEERRIKYEKQRQYAQEIAASANAAPPRSPGGSRGSRGRRVRNSSNQSPRSARGGDGGGSGFGYGDDDAVPFYLQQGQGQGPGSGSKAGRSSGFEGTEERMNKKQAQAEYFRQIQAAASQAPIASSRVSLRQRKLGMDAEGNDYRDMPMPHAHNAHDRHQDDGGAGGGPMDVASRAQAVAKERLLVKMRHEAAMRAEAEEAEYEARYQASKKDAHDAMGRGVGYHGAGAGSAGIAGGDNVYGRGMPEADGHGLSPNSKFYPGGGGDRAGYRMTREDSEAAPPADGYAAGRGGGGGGSGYQHYDAGAGGSPGGRYENVPVKRDNHMHSVMSVGYDERGGNDAGGGSAMNTGRLSGRRSAHTYDGDGDRGGGRTNQADAYDARAAKRLQQQRYAEEIAQAKAMQPIEGDRKATFRQTEENYNRGINLPGGGMQYLDSRDRDGGHHHHHQQQQQQQQQPHSGRRALW